MDYASAATSTTTTESLHRHQQQKEKLLVIMGATGTGKSRLSIDLAAHFPLEVINSDKMQVYNGLDITTNKISVSDPGLPCMSASSSTPATVKALT